MTAQKPADESPKMDHETETEQRLEPAFKYFVSLLDRHRISVEPFVKMDPARIDDVIRFIEAETTDVGDRDERVCLRSRDGRLGRGCESSLSV